MTTVFRLSFRERVRVLSGPLSLRERVRVRATGGRNRRFLRLVRTLAVQALTPGPSPNGRGENLFGQSHRAVPVEVFAEREDRHVVNLAQPGEEVGLGERGNHLLRTGYGGGGGRRLAVAQPHAQARVDQQQHPRVPHHFALGAPMRLEEEDQQAEERRGPQGRQQPAQQRVQLHRVATIEVADKQHHHQARRDRQNPIGVRLDASPVERRARKAVGQQRQRAMHHAAPPCARPRRSAG